jgi:type II restriction/modification system DNA methylase subunit YeeA
VQQQARTLAAQRDATSGARRIRLEHDLSRLLMGFVDQIAGMRILDPACGSGNFLYVALKQLLDLEQEVINLGADLGLSRMFPVVSPEQLHGIELNEYAHELAQITVWIGYLQWLRDNGYGELSEPILQSLTTIKHMDAILAFDQQGNPYEPAWPEADVVIGNPPFLGGNKVRKELGNQYVEALFKLYEGRVPAFADLVCYWFERARAHIEQGQLRRVGLLATNSIRGGVNRRVLENIKQSGDIFMGWSDRSWILDGAAVRVSMVGFDTGQEKERFLDGLCVNSINSDLTSTLDLIAATRLQENIGIQFEGTKKVLILILRLRLHRK